MQINTAYKITLSVGGFLLLMTGIPFGQGCGSAYHNGTEGDWIKEGYKEIVRVFQDNEVLACGAIGALAVCGIATLGVVMNQAANQKSSHDKAGFF